MNARNVKGGKTPAEAQATMADLRADDAKADPGPPDPQAAKDLIVAEAMVKDANKRTGLNYTDKANLIRALEGGMEWAQAKRLVTPDVQDRALEATRAEIVTAVDEALRKRSLVDQHNAQVAAQGKPLQAIAEAKRLGVMRGGIDSAEQERLVRLMADGMDWAHATRAVLFGCRVDPVSLEGWRPVLEKRALALAARK